MSIALQSNRRMKDELALRSARTALQGLRSRIEGNPTLYGGMLAKLEKAEIATDNGHIAQAGDRILEIEQFIADKDEAVATAAQLAEQEALSDARNTPTAKADSGVSTRDGWLWLLSKKRYSGPRVEAGRIFREKFTKAEASLKSCIGDSNGGGGTGAPLGNHARFELDGVKKHMVSAVGSTTGEALYSLIAAVVGRGETVRSLTDGDDRKADAKAVELGLALDLAGVYLGAVRI